MAREVKGAMACDILPFAIFIVLAFCTLLWSNGVCCILQASQTADTDEERWDDVVALRPPPPQMDDKIAYNTELPRCSLASSYQNCAKALFFQSTATWAILWPAMGAWGETGVLAIDHLSNLSNLWQFDGKYHCFQEERQKLALGERLARWTWNKEKSMKLFFSGQIDSFPKSALMIYWPNNFAHPKCRFNTYVATRRNFSIFSLINIATALILNHYNMIMINATQGNL